MSGHSVEKTRRQYNKWVATETIEDYALRYSPASYRQWSPWLLANTAIGSISFLALEAIGATLLLSFGYSNTIWAIVFASIIIFVAGFPISYYAARYNIDIDLLTRSAGFGYVGSTITSLIYASFCFIFFALEAAIMAQALLLYLELPLYLGYILCSLIIIPIVFNGITMINRLHLWTQPFWLLLMLLPLYFLQLKAPQAITSLMHFKGQISGSDDFDPYYFGLATGVSFSLIAQIGEQVDYLRFMPDKRHGNKMRWWISLLAAGPGWVVLGCFKQLVGALLAALAVLAGLSYAEAKEPVYMYQIAYSYVFDHPSTALLVSTIFVLISQVKINVTNAYAGSLAWSNFFSRVSHTHPGRVVWLVFNIGIALLLMELGVFEALQKVLGLYSNFAISWIAVVVADLLVNKPLKLSPSMIEFKRAHLYDYNPVGVVSMAVAVILSTMAFTGLFGHYAQAYSWLIALSTGFVLTPIIAKLTKGKYYIARQNNHFVNSDELTRCGVCDRDYAQTDFAYCPFHDIPICALCCTLDSSCRDRCKPKQSSPFFNTIYKGLELIFKHKLSKQHIKILAKVLLMASIMLGMVSVIFWLNFSINSYSLNSAVTAGIKTSLINLFFALAVLLCVFAWWIILKQESQALAETELEEQNEHLDNEIKERKAVQQELNSRTKELALHNEILNVIGQGTRLPDICDQLVRKVEKLHPDMCCSILLMDEEGQHLLQMAAPSMPDFYNRAINGLSIGEGVGSCGTAAFRGERVIVEDIQQHPYWTLFQDLARQAGVQSCWSEPIINSQGKVLGTFAIYHRTPRYPSAAKIKLISNYANLVLLAIERNQAEQKLRLAATAFETQQAIIITDANCIIMQINHAFTDSTGYLPAELIGKHVSILKSGLHEESFYAEMWESINRLGTWQGEVWGQRKNGELYPKWITITSVKDAGNKITHYVSAQTDITARKTAEDEIKNLAFYDPLTKLPNRRLLRDRLQHAQFSNARTGVYGALFFIDLDNFKTINDTLGHDKGDMLLEQVAYRLLACVRECDTVARLGGDEFVIMLEDLSAEYAEAALQAETVGENILMTLNRPYLLEDHNYFSTPSIGITLYSDQKNSIDELLIQSDIAMYQAKASGKNALRFFDAAMQALITQRAAMEEELRNGLQKNQFILYYQPQVDELGRIGGAEVLLRWQNDRGELVAPNRFIFVAEETGLIIPLGCWVLETACEQLVVWSKQPAMSELMVSVNVSVRQFRQSDFVEQVLSIINRTGANPHRLMLELTESLLASDVDDIIHKMSALKAHGLTFALDDFGTGYSSLYYLKQLPLDQLKIDQNFVRDILIDSNDAAIAKMIIALSEAMGLSVIAEGVETEAQKIYLAAMGCHEFQGYLFGKPMPVDEFICKAQSHP